MFTHTRVARYNPHHCGNVNISRKLRLCTKTLLAYQIGSSGTTAGGTVRGARGHRVLTVPGREPTGWRKETGRVRSPVGGC